MITLMFTEFMTTPFKSVGHGILDSFNYHHLQIRINIECALGMLIHRWGCLRKLLPVNITIKKTCDIVKCSWILHKYCINERLLRSHEIHNCIETLVSDSTFILMNGGPLSNTLDNRDNNVSAMANDYGYFSVTTTFDSKMDCEHHFDYCPTTRVRMQLAEPQLMGDILSWFLSLH